MTVLEFLAQWHDDSPFVIAHTSGSTGRPKEVRLLKSDMQASAALTNRFFGINKESRLMLCLSPDYIAGKMMIVRAEEAGATLLTETPGNRPLEHYAGAKIDLLAVVPSQALWLAQHPDRLANVRKLIVGGGEVSPHLRKLLENMPVEAYATYGMTETCSHVALAPITADISPFTALPPVTFTTDQRSCLIIEAPQFSFRRLVTNDVVELLSPTSFFWKGRVDNVVNTGGIKVFPEEIERKIRGWLSRRHYITSRPSEKWGQELILKVEGEPFSASQVQILLEKLRETLPFFELPKDIVFVPRFEETSSGKIKRKKMQKKGL